MVVDPYIYIFIYLFITHTHIYIYYVICYIILYSIYNWERYWVEGITHLLSGMHPQASHISHHLELLSLLRSNVATNPNETPSTRDKLLIQQARLDVITLHDLYIILTGCMGCYRSPGLAWSHGK